MADTADCMLPKSQSISKQQRMRMLKKINKQKSNLIVKENLHLSNEPTRILVVKNGGLGNNVKQEDILPLFQQYGELQEIIMLPRKQYCFICYTLESHAEQALNHLNGHLLRECKDPTQNVVLYLFYVKEAPPSVIPSSEKPPGLIIIEDFITEETENSLLQLVQQDTQTDFIGVMKHRQVKHYGYEFKYGINDVDANSPLPVGIPQVCDEFLNKALSLGLVQHFPDQLTVNQYKPGQGIPPHVDTVDAFEDGIMSLSSGSQVVMDFRHPDGQHLKVLLPRRSLLVMTGDSRYVWSHGITPRKSDTVSIQDGTGVTLVNRSMRTSFTFRKVVKNRKPSADVVNSPCNETLPPTGNEALDFERQHVHRVYNDIAEHFSGTRYKPWPKVVEFLVEQPPLSLLADVGCGNGKCLGVAKQLFEVGSDYSSNLANICRSRGFETCVADVTCLPFRENSFDIVLCIAVIHHMVTQERRIKAVREIVRILRVGGRALFYVWALEQEHNKMQSKYINSNRQKKIVGRKTEESNTELNSLDTNTSDISYSNQSGESKLSSLKLADNCGDSGKVQEASSNPLEPSAKPLQVHLNRTQFQKQDMLVPWQLKCKPTSTSQSETSSKESQPTVFHRYYHVFKEGELESLFEQVSNCSIRKSYYDQGNWCVVIEKTEFIE